VRNTTLLNLCNCFATRQAARHVTRLYERHLAGADVTSAQYSILVEYSGEDDRPFRLNVTDYSG